MGWGGLWCRPPVHAGGEAAAAGDVPGEEGTAVERSTGHTHTHTTAEHTTAEQTAHTKRGELGCRPAGGAVAWEGLGRIPRTLEIGDGGTHAPLLVAPWPNTSGIGLEGRAADDDMLTPTGYPPPKTAAGTAHNHHSAHSTQPALRPHCATPRVEDNTAGGVRGGPASLRIAEAERDGEPDTLAWHVTLQAG